MFQIFFFCLEESTLYHNNHSNRYLNNNINIKQCKILNRPITYTIINKHTMMIHIKNTSFALRTMMNTLNFQNYTFITDIIFIIYLLRFKVFWIHKTWITPPSFPMTPCSENLKCSHNKEQNIMLICIKNITMSPIKLICHSNRNSYWAQIVKYRKHLCKKFND